MLLADVTGYTYLIKFTRTLYENPLAALFSAALQTTAVVAAQPNSAAINCGEVTSSDTPAWVATDCAKAEGQMEPRSEGWTVDALSYLQSALSHLKNGDRVSATGDLDQAIKLNPHLAEAYFTRGSIHAEDRNFDRALLDFDEAISLNPVLTDAFHQRALAYRGKLEFPKH